MRVIFWSAAVFTGYVYVGYPALLYVWTRLRSRRDAVPPAGNEVPGISIVIAARNEAHRLAARIENLMSADYPANRRQIIVVSDGSTDGTERTLQRFGDAVAFVAVPAGGKALALNAGVAAARHEVLVFADARQRFAPDALRELVAPLADAAVGGVTGELVLDCELTDRRHAARDRRLSARADGIDRRQAASTIGVGVGAYWRYEKALRRMESAVGSTLGATGAIYALRRALWKPLAAGTMLDDVLAPMRAVLAGRRVVFNPRARAFDAASRDADAEHARKVRTLAGNFQILWLEPRLLAPWANPVWLQYMSHKVGRLFVPYALIASFASSLALAPAHAFYGACLALQCAFYLLAGYGAVLDARDRSSARRVEARPPLPAVRPGEVVNA